MFWLRRAMLGSLGVGAIAGVLAVLVGDSDFAGAVMLTALWCAIACGLLLRTASWAERPESRTAFVFAGCSTSVMLIIATALTWGDQLDMQSETFGFLGLSLLAIFACSGVITTGLRLRGSGVPAGRWFVLFGAIALGILLTGNALGTYGEADDRWRLSITGCLFFACTIVGAAVHIHPRPTDRLLRWTGGIGAGVAFAIGAAETWEIVKLERPIGATLFTAAGALALVSLHIRLLYTPQLPREARKWQALTSLAAAATGVLITFAVAYSREGANETLHRVLAAAAILSSAGSLAVVVLAIFARRARRATPSVESTIQTIRLECPGCSSMQTIALGGATCPGCGLRIRVDLD
jgi:hypothetical protein